MRTKHDQFFLAVVNDQDVVLSGGVYVNDTNQAFDVDEEVKY